MFRNSTGFLKRKSDGIDFLKSFNFFFLKKKKEKENTHTKKLKRSSSADQMNYSEEARALELTVRIWLEVHDGRPFEAPLDEFPPSVWGIALAQQYWRVGALQHRDEPCLPKGSHLVNEIMKMCSAKVDTELLGLLFEQRDIKDAILFLISVEEDFHSNKGKK